MLHVTLPDGSRKSFEQPTTVAAVAQSIGAGLARASLAARVDGKLVDLSHELTQDASVALITERDDAGLEIIRHSTAHLLAWAVKSLFPAAQVTIGPVIEDGFYYDFAFERAFTPEDLLAIENKMRELAARDEPVTREEWRRDDAVKFFLDQGEKYKAEIIASIPTNEAISLYREGEFIDLCRGPHVPSTGRLKVFKLMKVAGAYWRGDSNNEMLQRIYGTAWTRKEDLDAYLKRLEEAERRDHRKLGKQLDLFHLQDEAPGLVFWHPKGWVIWQQIEQYMRRVYVDNGYHEVRCPQILDRSLWERTGHWQNYREHMFTTESEKRDFAVKPMNCPGHILVYRSQLRSYRDLPLRYGEFGACHRNETSGSLHGLMRVRGLTQDDGHIFCTQEQIQSEVRDFNALVGRVYADFGFHDVAVKLALRPQKRIGSDDVWDRAEQALRQGLADSGLRWEELPGEGAFYGPKIEFHIKDAIGRSWQCGTMQVDFFMPGKLGAEYVGEDNTRQTPVMLHRAIFGSLERFIGILIEHFEGNFPLWLAPVQAAVLSISAPSSAYAQSVAKRLQQAGLRVQSDVRDDKIAYKIREHALQKLPYLIVVGEQESAQETITVRARGNQNLGTMSVDAFVSRVREELSQRR